MTDKARVRFAPSPTGALHIGSVRTALFNWLFARRHGGKFILRVEDTDQGRSTEGFINEIMQGMRWLGLDWDEGPDIGGDYGPYRQTEKKDVYLKYVVRLLETSKAYRCYCSAAELEEQRKIALAKGGKPKYNGHCRNLEVYPEDKPHVVRFKNPGAGTITVNDLLRGDISFDNSELDDFIILRTDGTPTYNFVVVIDDVDMKITHVIRGDDHLPNTPRQAQIYSGLGAPMPKFAHISLIMGQDKTRLSKRHGATSILAYRDMGYLPEAMVNYLVRLGWAHGDEEIFTREQMVEKFSLDNVNTSAAIFDPEKLLWVSSRHIKLAPIKKLAALLQEQIGREKLVDGQISQDLLEKIVPLYQERSKTLSEMATQAAFFFQDVLTYEEKARRKFLVPENSAVFQGLIQLLEVESDFAISRLEEILNGFAETSGLKIGKIAQPLRVALTGKTASPGIFDVMAVLGKEKVLHRIREAVKQIA